jgi:hypothetical protein
MKIRRKTIVYRAVNIFLGKTSSISGWLFLLIALLALINDITGGTLSEYAQELDALRIATYALTVLAIYVGAKYAYAEYEDVLIVALSRAPALFALSYIDFSRSDGENSRAIAWFIVGFLALAVLFYYRAKDRVQTEMVIANLEKTDGLVITRRAKNQLHKFWKLARNKGEPLTKERLLEIYHDLKRKGMLDEGDAEDKKNGETES